MGESEGGSLGVVARLEKELVCSVCGRISARPDGCCRRENGGQRRLSIRVVVNLDHSRGM